MTRDAATGEIEKLAHQLGVPTWDLAGVEGAPPEALRQLRRQIGDLLFEADRHHFARMATLSKAVPIAVAAKISELALPPLLAARTAELFEPHRAVEMVGHMSDRYLAHVAVAMDPARCPDVIAALPPDRVAQVGRELARQGEWFAMGAFVSFVNAAALEAAVQALDGEQLLRISFVLDDTSRLGEISAHLTERQLDQMLQAAAAHGLWRELDDLLADLGPDRAAPLASRYPMLDASVREAVTVAREEGQLSAASFRWLTS